jgi:high affinity Mn2+ porin
MSVGQGLGLNPAFTGLGYFGSRAERGGVPRQRCQPGRLGTILGQAWYQAAIPLPFGGFKPTSRETLELTFGKMDIFGFFDQNTAAGDETTQFLNSVFVHNPLLDAGGEVGVDANGFQPGFVTPMSTVPTSRNRGVCRSASSAPANAAPTTSAVFDSPL